MNFLKGIDVCQGWAYKGRRFLGPPDVGEVCKNFPENSVKNYNFQANFLMKFFSKILNNLLEFFAKTLTNI